jgi:hypothetical protein
VHLVLGVFLFLAMDVAFEFHVLHLDFVAYAPGLVVGLLISLAFGGMTPIRA